MFDSNGNPLIMNGDGSFVKEFDNAVLEGKVKDYHMNGEWSLDSDGVKLLRSTREVILFLVRRVVVIIYQVAKAFRIHCGI